MEKLGSWSFIIGLAIAILVGLFTEASGIIVTVLVILGVIVGFLNVTDKEVSNFLIASVALMLAGGAKLDMIPVVGGILVRVLANVVVFVAPAAIIVAIKAIYELASN